MRLPTPLGMTLPYCPEQAPTKAVDKWVLGGAEAPQNFWYLYLKDIAHSHSAQLLIMCSES